MIAGLYAEVSIICMLILLVIFYKIETNVDLRRSQQLLAIDILLFIVVTLTDTTWSLINGGYVVSSPLAKNIVNIAYFCASAISAYIWFIYCVYYTGMSFAKNRLFLGLSLIPAIGLIVLSANSPFTHWIFYINESGNYIRGSLNFCSYTINYGYIAIASIIAIYGAVQKKNVINKKLFLSFASLMVCIIIVGGLQIVAPQYPLLAVGITLPFFLVYLTLTDTLITMDGLTLLNNKNWFYFYHTENNPSELGKDGKHYLLIADIDSLDSINSTNGNSAGDLTLKYMAKALNNTANYYLGKCSMLSCRYGDDEFISIIHIPEYEVSIDDITSHIQIEINNLIKKNNIPYHINICTGYSMYSEDIIYVQDLVEMADQNMYANKRKHF